MIIGGFSDIRRRAAHSWLCAPIKVPIIDWFPLYTKSDFFNDAIAGFTVFVLLIPQGLSYAVLAGMPPVYGLYTATFPCFIYALLGTSKQLSMGPMAITSLLLGTSIHALGYTEGTEDYITVALNISMLSGIFLFLLGFLRVGILVNFLSHSVLTGFITASALLIALSQLKYITGIVVPRYKYSMQTVIYLLTHLNECNPAALIIGILSWILLYYIKLWKRKNKVSTDPAHPSTLLLRILSNLANMSSLIATLITALITYLLYQNGITLQIVGYVPAGIKAPSFQFLGFNTLLQLVSPSFILALISFAGNWAVTKKFALLYQYEVDATQELIAEGLTNILGVLLANAFVISGGLARSAVNAESGAKTQISGCISACLIIFALLTITSVFYYIPMAILGAIIEVSVASMFDFEEMKKSYYIDKHDFMVMVTTFLITFFIGISEGIFTGVLLSIVFVINPSAFPNIIHLGKLSDSEGGHYKDITRFPTAVQLKNIAIVRIDASLYFANVNYFKEIIRKAARGDYHHKNNHNNNRGYSNSLAASSSPLMSTDCDTPDHTNNNHNNNICNKDTTITSPLHVEIVSTSTSPLSSSTTILPITNTIPIPIPPSIIISISNNSRRPHTVSTIYDDDTGLPIKLVIIDASAWIDIDLCGINTIIEIQAELISQDILLALANVKGCLRDKLQCIHFIQSSPQEYIYMSIDDAVKKLQQYRSVVLKEQLVAEAQANTISGIHNQKQQQYDPLHNNDINNGQQIGNRIYFNRSLSYRRIGGISTATANNDDYNNGDGGIDMRRNSTNRLVSIDENETAEVNDTVEEKQLKSTIRRSSYNNNSSNTLRHRSVSLSHTLVSSVDVDIYDEDSVITNKHNNNTNNKHNNNTNNNSTIVQTQIKKPHPIITRTSSFFSTSFSASRSPSPLPLSTTAANNNSSGSDKKNRLSSSSAVVEQLGSYDDYYDSIDQQQQQNTETATASNDNSSSSNDSRRTFILRNLSDRNIWTYDI